MNSLTPDQLHILQHSLGVDEYGRSTHRRNSDDWRGCYRNRYITQASCPAGMKCQELVALGFMFDHGPQNLAGGMNCYSVTDAGYNAMRAASPRPPKLTRSQRTYKAYRVVADLFPGGFGQFLKCPQLKRMVEDYGNA